MFEQNLQNLIMQRQNFQVQLSEIDSALNELKGVKEAYKMVAGIMVLSKKEDINKSLKEKKEMFELRIKKLEEQEKLINEKAKKIQSEVLSEVEETKK